MPYSRFTLSEVVTQFGLTVDYNAELFPTVRPIAPSDLLQQELAVKVPLALANNTEKARSEMIIAPILLEIYRLSTPQVSLFSGVNFDVDIELGLNGFCDFILSQSDDPYFVQAPVFAVIEAKNEDIRSGLGQCVAAMVGAQLFNQRRNRPTTPIYGAVTLGNIWKFLSLTGNRVQIERNEVYLEPVDHLLGVLFQIVGY